MQISNTIFRVSILIFNIKCEVGFVIILFQAFIYLVLHVYSSNAFSTMQYLLAYVKRFEDVLLQSKAVRN
jgi:hypothetical protein